MKKIKLVILLFIISPYYLLAQNIFFESLINKFQEDALFREKVFIHVNKTTYFSRENVWFSAYVSEDSSNIPSDYTTNLHVNLLNHKGDIIQSKNIFVRKGIGLGDFLIDDKYPSGKYYIQGFTNFMQNFGDKNVFIHEIEIINPSKPEEKKINNKWANYDIQVFPESGYLLESAENSLGIKVLVNGKGYPFSGKITNSKGTEITAFQGNLFGLSKCDFIYDKNEVYNCIIAINNTIHKISLPKAKKTGIIFSIKNTDEENIKLTLKTNKETLPSLKGETLNLLFYRNNLVCEAITLTINSKEETTQELLIKKNKLLNGVNIATLFKSNNPIAERKFFIDKSDEQTAILIEEFEVEKDSINYKIQTVDSYFKPISTQMSISILPENSKVFYEKQNIKSAFLLSPYVKGHIENPSYYFKNINLKEKENLDLLLLNQGWSTYSLEEKIMEVNPNEKFQFESGFTLNGNIKHFPNKYNIGIISKKNRLVALSKINEKNEFSFENVFAYRNDSIKIALVTKEKPLVKPSRMTFTKGRRDEQNYAFLIEGFNYSVNETKSSKETSYDHYPNLVQLDEIILNTTKPKRKESIYDLEMNLARKHQVLAAGSYKNKKVTKQMETIYQSVFDYFNSLGYIKPVASKNGTPYLISLRNTPATFFSGNANSDKTFPPRIYIDDAAINRYDVIEMLKELSMTDVDDILINKTGAGGGLNGTGGIIKIYRKKASHKYFGAFEKKLYESLVLQTGFDRANDYYTPQYNIYTKEANDWSEVFWYNSVRTNDKGEVFVKVPSNEFSNEFKFIINGVSENGLLFYDNFKVGNEDF